MSSGLVMLLKAKDKLSTPKSENFQNFTIENSSTRPPLAHKLSQQQKKFDFPLWREVWTCQMIFLINTGHDFWYHHWILLKFSIYFHARVMFCRNQISEWEGTACTGIAALICQWPLDGYKIRTSNSSTLSVRCISTELRLGFSIWWPNSWSAIDERTWFTGLWTCRRKCVSGILAITEVIKEAEQMLITPGKRRSERISTAQVRESTLPLSPFPLLFLFLASKHIAW